MNNLTPASLKTAFSHFLGRFHMLIFTIIVLGGLTVCMFLINGIISQTGNSSNTSDATPTQDFDQATIDRIKQLHTAGDSSSAPLNLPSGRINPFVD